MLSTISDATVATISELATRLGIDSENTIREAMFAGISDGAEQGPELSSGMTFDRSEAQHAYDFGTYIGAAIWSARMPKEVVEEEPTNGQ